MITRNAADLETAARLFPFDVRFRRGPSLIWLNAENSAQAVKVLKRAQREDPYSPDFVQALMIHELRIGDSEGASDQFRLLYRLAPHSETIRLILAERAKREKL